MDSLLFRRKSVQRGTKLVNVGHKLRDLLSLGDHFELTDYRLSVSINSSQLEQALSVVHGDLSDATNILFEDIFVTCGEQRIELHITWLETDLENASLSFRVLLNPTAPNDILEVPAVSQYWPAARASELEAEKLYGIRFSQAHEAALTFGIGEVGLGARFPMRKEGARSKNGS
jgi:hypothetical protein